MHKIQTKYASFATTGALAALLISCAGDGSDGKQNPGQTGVTSTSTASNGDLANKEAELRAAHQSAGAAKDNAKGCFDALRGCMGDGGAGAAGPDQACLDKLKGCLPAAPPPPVGCPTLPDPTPEQITAADDAVGKTDDLVGQIADNVGPTIDDLATQAEQAVDALLDGGIPLPTFPDGGFPFPAPGTQNPGAGGHNKGRGDGGLPGIPGPWADGGFPVPHFDAGAGLPWPARDASLPQLSPDATIGGGDLCGIPLPQLPIGALKACADQAATDLKGGSDPISVATSAIECIEKPFQADIAQLCGDVTSLCGQPDAPPNICGDVSDICSALTSP